MNQRWRYLVCKLKMRFSGSIKEGELQQELDRQGNQGWELVQIVLPPAGWGEVQLVFKKPG